jgi:hypothetical protein
MITGLRLEHFRGFINSGDLEFGKINLFYGPNSGGKSTILRALSLLKQSFNHNRVDHLCVLLPYSRDGVDMGSATSLHHNLDTSTPFLMSLSSRGRQEREVFRIARALTAPVDQSTNVLSSQARPTAEAQGGTNLFASVTHLLKAGMGIDNKEVFLEDATAEWTLCLAIADDGPIPSSTLQQIRFGNSHFMVHARKVEQSSGRGRNAFMDELRSIVAPGYSGEDFEVLGEIGSQATRRRFTARQASRLWGRFKRSTQVSLDDEVSASGCYSVDNVVLSNDYEKALGAYLRDCREDIAAFARAVLGDLIKLQSGDQGRAANVTSSADEFRTGLRVFFAAVADLFEVDRDAAEYAAWWKEDLRRSRLLLFGYVNAEYDSSDIPPLAYWMTSEWWTAWRTKCAVRATVQAEQETSQKKGVPYLLDGQCDDIDDVVSVFVTAVEVIEQSLYAIRDIGPDRVSAERVYRIEPRQHAARDHVGRRAAEIPRLLHESPRLLEELNSWLRRVEVPYRLIVDTLEIRGGGGGDVRQTGLFELNAELAHSCNARINLSDVGHGLFKQLALPTQIFLGRNLIITIEEPETNVHPRLQAEIADLFIDAVTKYGHQIFAEAHSEILSLRLQRRIAEGRISHEDVRLFYVHAPEHGPCEVLPLALNQHGILLNEPPGGFFDEWLREV